MELGLFTAAPVDIFTRTTCEVYLLPGASSASSSSSTSSSSGQLHVTKRNTALHCYEALTLILVLQYNTV